MDVKQLLKTTIGKIRMLFAEEEIFYIGGSDVLPPPLEKEQEQKCLVALSDLTTKKKDYSKEDARKMLIEHNLRLVVYLAKKFENTGICVEDLISIGTIGLIKGINTFNPEKKIKLATYASRCIENEILMYLRRNNKIRLLRDAVEKLDPREKEIICLRYGINRKDGKEMTQKEVADLLGISQSYISRLEKKIMIRLKKEIQKN